MSKKITIYELLELIKDGKAPNRILYDHYIWSWTGDDYHTILKTEKEQFLITGMYYTWVSEFLNDKVEIIEEDNNVIGKILTTYDGEIIDYVNGEKHLINTNRKDINIYIPKINELIDEINKLKRNNK